MAKPTDVQVETGPEGELMVKAAGPTKRQMAEHVEKALKFVSAYCYNFELIVVDFQLVFVYRTSAAARKRGGPASEGLFLTKEAIAYVDVSL